jgi:Skp family chaperone for outer membrane proteins
MNAKMKQHLTAVVTAIVNEDSATAKEAFHKYASLKTKAILLGEESKDDEEVDADIDEDEKDVDEDEKDEEKESKDLKKTKKDLAKTKKDQKKDVEDEDKED